MNSIIFAVDLYKIIIKTIRQRENTCGLIVFNYCSRNKNQYYFKFM